MGRLDALRNALIDPTARGAVNAGVSSVAPRADQSRQQSRDIVGAPRPGGFGTGTSSTQGGSYTKPIYIYYNAQGKPYNGEDYSFWQSGGQWYRGQKGTNQVTGVNYAPWQPPLSYQDFLSKYFNKPGVNAQSIAQETGMTPEDVMMYISRAQFDALPDTQKGGAKNSFGGDTGGTGGTGGGNQNVTYYNRSGGLYNPSTDDVSYWQTADGKWWMGDKNGAISAVDTPPWKNQIDPFMDQKLNALIDKLSSMPYDQGYVDLMGGKLNEQLQNTGAAQRQELADRMASQGVFGGAAQGALTGLEGQQALGMSQGMSSIFQTAMDRAYQDRQAALQALLGKESILSNQAIQKLQIALQEKLGMGQLGISQQQQDLAKLLGITDRQLQMEMFNKQYDLNTREGQMSYALQLLQLAQYSDKEEADRLIQLAFQYLTPSAGAEGG